ncbi:MAG: ChaN family lipoprotein [bacterium]
MKYKWNYIMLMVFLLCSSSAILYAQGENPYADCYKIYSGNLGKLIDIDQIVEDFANYDVIIFGEEHNDAVAHYLELLLFQKLHDGYEGMIALSLEMFDRDVQVILDEYLNGQITEKHFKKDARIWINYEDYRPLVEFAKTSKIDVIAANAPMRYTNIARTRGQDALLAISETAKSFLAPLPYDTATGEYREKLLKVQEVLEPLLIKKDTLMPGDKMQKKMPLAMMVFRINQGQSLWDATMAYAIYQYRKHNKDNKVLHINGKFHSDEYFGVVQQLKRYDPEVKILVISSFPNDQFPDVNFTEYTYLADYIIITDPSVARSFEQ